jgi:flagellar motor switch protein FliG
VSNFSYPRFSVVIDDVRRVQNELEGYFIAQQKTIDETALSLLKSSKGETVEYLTNYSIGSAEQTYKLWKQLGEELLQKTLTEFLKQNSLPQKILVILISLRRKLSKSPVINLR